MGSKLSDNFEELKAQVKTLPRHPGVYLMRDKQGETIYVGKARDLRARVKTYFAGGDGRSQIEFLLRRISKLETIVTDSEEQALVLERDLITKYKPRYNIMLKDDKAYLSIRIDKNSKWPRIELVRKVEQDGALYFGPYPGGSKIRELLEIIKNVIPLRTCTNTVFYNRQRPCLEYQIKRCLAPCVLAVDEREYAQWLNEAIKLLQGKTEAIVASLNERMEKASQELRFEDAALYRDKISLLEQFSRSDSAKFHHAESRDCFAIYREGSMAAVCVMVVRNGRISDSQIFSFNDVQITDAELIETVVLQYYGGQRDLPEEILIPTEALDPTMLLHGLKRLREGPLEILVPKQGSKHRLLRLAELNAEQAYQAKFNAEERYTNIARHLSQKFKLRQIPRRIECVDISNLQGSDIVGAIVSFFDGHPDKERYRKYKISFQDKPDDFKAIEEVVFRRLSRGKAEENLPDLLIIDGGSMQLEKALAAAKRAEVDIDIIALAKMRSNWESTGRSQTSTPERVFLTPESDSIELSEGDELTHFLQRIRDEVHRFVITFHRRRRTQRVMRSVLDDIPGVGPERRARLLRHFGNVKSMRSVSVNEIAKVGRMPAKLAEKIKRIIAS